MFIPYICLAGIFALQSFILIYKMIKQKQYNP